MNSLKRANLVVVVVMVLAMALPAVTYAWMDEGAGVVSQSAEREITGTLKQVTDDFIVVDGQQIALGPGTEVEGPLTEGAVVKVHVSVSDDGNMVAREIELADAGNSNDNASDVIDDNDNANANDNSADNANSNDNSNSNDDDDNSNSNDDDDNSNSNDDDDNSNSNDDDDNSNSNDDDDDDSDDDNSNDNDDSRDDDDD